MSQALKPRHQTDLIPADLKHLLHEGSEALWPGDLRDPFQRSLKPFSPTISKTHCIGGLKPFARANSQTKFKGGSKAL